MEIETITTITFNDKDKVNGMIDVRACNKPAGKVRRFKIIKLNLRRASICIDQ